MHVDSSRVLGIFAGGVIGTALRVALAGTTAPDAWPVGTLVVNLIGTAVLAFWIGYVEIRSDGMRDFLQVGLLGAFTTFSTFAVEVAALINKPLYAVSYAVVSIAAGLLVAVGAMNLGGGARNRNRGPQVLEGYQ